MASPTYTSALIVGAGQGLSASLTRTLRKEGLAVAIAARLEREQSFEAHGRGLSPTIAEFSTLPLTPLPSAREKRVPL